MSHITLAQQGMAAAEARNWDEAITKLSAALKSSTNPTWLLTRSKALINTRRFEEALDDANLAWHKAYERNQRTNMADAHYRRAVAYLRMGRHADADCCCIYAMRLMTGHSAVEKEDPGAIWTDAEGIWTATLEDATSEARTNAMNGGQDGGMSMAMGGEGPANAKEWRMASTLRLQILGSLKNLPADDKGRKRSVTFNPLEKKLANVKLGTEPETKSATTTMATPQPTTKLVVPQDTPLRLQEFQSNTTMSVSIFSKGVNKEKLQVDFSASSVRLEPLVYPSGEEKAYVLDLWGEIDAAASKITVTPNKVELNLAKKVAGKWPQLKKAEDTPSSTSKPSSETAPARATTETPKSETQKPVAAAAAAADNKDKQSEKTEKSGSGTSYPTSSRTGPKNWDKITEGEDDEEESDVNLFFKKIYKNATPEQQRAMMKSFTESNGTSLSTDWDDVKSRTVETVPPEGVEAKKWQK